MPTPIPIGEKDAFIAIVQAAPYPGGQQEAYRLQSVLVNYEDIPVAIGRELPLFASNNGYLTAAMAVFTDSALQAVGIYNAKTGTTLADAVMIINSTYTGTVTLSAKTVIPGLTILGTSTVNRVTLATNINLSNLYIGPGSILNIVDSSVAGAFINNIWLPYLKSTPSILKTAVNGSQIGNIEIDEGSYYGGQSYVPESGSCSMPVTDLVVGIITHNTLSLTWTNPEEYLFINVYYRKKGSNVWLQATDVTGNFDGATGYTFNTLESETDYEFQVIVTCVNGILSNPTEVSGNTTCC